MKLREIVVEARRNILSRTSHAGILALILGLVSTGCVVGDIASIRALELQAESFREAGGATMIETAKGSVLGGVCDSIARTVPRAVAGAIRESNAPVIAAKLPSSVVPTFEVSPGFTELILKRPAADLGGGVLVSDNFAKALSLKVGDYFATTAGSARVADIYSYPDDGRRRGLGYAVLVPVPLQVAQSTPFDECWASIWPQSTEIDALMRVAVAPQAAEGAPPASLEQLNQSQGVRFDGPQRLHSRVAQYLPLGGFIVSLFVAFSIYRTRRLEFASARHAGVTTSDLWLITQTESAPWVVSVWLLPFGPALLTLFGTPDPTAYLGFAWQGPSLVMAGGLMGATFAALLASERTLFRDFKRRR